MAHLLVNHWFSSKPFLVFFVFFRFSILGHAVQRAYQSQPINGIEDSPKHNQQIQTQAFYKHSIRHETNNELAPRSILLAFVVKPDLVGTQQNKKTMKYWQVTVVFEIVSDSGRNQKVKELYLVEAVSATDAEAKIYKNFEGESNFTVIKAEQSRILEVIEG